MTPSTLHGPGDTRGANRRRRGGPGRTRAWASRHSRLGVGSAVAVEAHDSSPDAVRQPVAPATREPAAQWGGGEAAPLSAVIGNHAFSAIAGVSAPAPASGAADNKAAADAKETRDAIIGVIIGVESAYTSVPLLEAMALRKLLVETGGELAELVASKAKEAAEGEQEPAAPDKLTPELMELEQSRELVKLYRSLAVLQAGDDTGAISSACDKVIIEIERFDEGRNKFPAAKLDGFIAALVKKEPVAKSTKDKTTAARKDLDAKLRDVEKRMALNDPEEILKDIWTRWLAAGNEPGMNAWAEIERLGIQRSYGFLQPITQEGGGPGQAAAARALRGKVGTAATDLCPTGEVLVDGAPWPATARYGDSIPSGTTIRVTGIQGMPGPTPFGGPPSE